MFGRNGMLVLTFVSRFKYSRSRVYWRLTSPDGRRVYPSSSGHHQNGGVRNRGSRFDDSRTHRSHGPRCYNGFDVLAGKPSLSLDNGGWSHGDHNTRGVQCTRHGVTHETAGLKENSPLRCPGGIRWRR